jgi:cyclophilin family peptidyl-prolyl cis-trans isomerase
MTNNQASSAIRELIKRDAKGRALAILVSACALFLAACGGETNTNTSASNTSAANRNQPSTGQTANQNSAPTAANANQSAAAQTGANPIAVIETDAGTIKVELLRSEAPVTVENFVQLANRKYYNNIIFHRVIKGFMIQGGDPAGMGTGGETATGRPLPNEINLNSPLYQGGYKRGQVAMANKGRPESGSSQFFIMHQNYPLQPNYTIFGRVIEGMETVDKIATAQTGANDRPVSPVKMTSVTIQ